MKLAVYARDHYVCRYSHCRRCVVDERVFQALSALLPDTLPFHRNWKGGACHPLVWTSLASLEHVKPWSIGGDNSVENLITACTLCNYAKNSALVEQLGWKVDLSAAEGYGWEGLTPFLPALRALVLQ